MIEEKKKKSKVAPITSEEPAKLADNEIQDIDLGIVEKRKFRIAGDYNRMLELNVSDLNIFKRYKETYPKLTALLQDAQKKVAEISVDDDENESGVSLSKLADTLDEIDAEMRRLMDYLFDSNVSEVCAPSGNMFDPVNGDFRFEVIITKLATLYSTGLEDEIKKFKNKSSKYTDKYQKKYHN